MSSEKAKISRSKRISSVWILPLLAAIIGSWMVANAYMNRGPDVRIEFATAEGLVEGKTKIKARSVGIGLVSSVKLSHDHRSVIVTARIDKDASGLLTEDAEFWVVKPRVGTSGVTGIGTLLSGAYIELAPGESKAGRREFVGLEDLPVTPAGTPGVHVLLKSEEGNALSVGDPVLYRGYHVGRIETSTFDSASRIFSYKAFIEAPYNDLLSSSSRFWNASGFSIRANADGVSLDAGTFESMALGGVAFDLPEGSKTGQKISSDYAFKLYPDRSSASEEPFDFFAEYLLLFENSVRGLSVGAPVEYRGMKVGSVEGISFGFLPEAARIARERTPIPVLIRLEPGRLDWEDSLEAKEALVADLGRRVGLGLRASLETGNLLTGSLYVSLDFHENAERQKIQDIGGYPVLPTISSGFEQIEKKVVQILDTVAELPLAETLASAEEALYELEKTLDSADQLVEELSSYLEREDTQRIPSSIQESLEQLDKTLEGFGPESEFHQELLDAVREVEAAMKSVDDFAEILKAKPNSLIFSGKRKADPEPKAKRK